MVGAEFLPQTSILPQVDVVITHGGNNTVTESLYFGKPMVVLPLFWDQHDNAQRLDETGLGIRLDTYGHAPDELSAALDRLLADEPSDAATAGGVAAAARRPRDGAGRRPDRAGDRSQPLDRRCGGDWLRGSARRCSWPALTPTGGRR